MGLQVYCSESETAHVGAVPLAAVDDTKMKELYAAAPVVNREFPVG